MPKYAISVTIEEVEKLAVELKTLPDKVKIQALRNVYRRAARPLLKDMVQKAPTGKGKNKGNLKRSIAIRYNRNKNTPLAFVGPNRKRGVDAFYSNFVIRGTKAHEIKGKNITFVTGGKKYTVTKVEHPGAKGNPFVDDAYNATQQQVIESLKSESLAEIKKIWLKRKTGKL